MFQPTNAPSTSRMLAEFGPAAPGWWPARQLHPAARPASDGYRVRGRRRRSWWFDFTVSMVNIWGPALLLWALIFVRPGAWYPVIGHVAVVVGL